MGWFKVAQLIGSKGGKKVSETITSLRGKSRLAVGNKQPVSGSGAARRQKDVTWV